MAAEGGTYTKVMMALITCDVVEYLVELCTRPCLRIIQAAEDRRHQTHDEQQAEVDDNVEVGFFLYLVSFRRGVSVIEHDLRDCTSKHDHPFNPTRIPECTTAPSAW